MVKPAIFIVDAKYDQLTCGHCYSVLMGYDEEVCPSCGGFNDFNNMVKMTEAEVRRNDPDLPSFFGGPEK